MLPRKAWPEGAVLSFPPRSRASPTEIRPFPHPVPNRRMARGQSLVTSLDKMTKTASVYTQRVPPHLVRVIELELFFSGCH